MPKIRRASSILCFLLLLGLPLSARGLGEPAVPFEPLARLLSALWERFAPPIASWAADEGSVETSDSSSDDPSDPPAKEEEDPDSRGTWDPNG